MQKNTFKPVVLVVLDGWGLSKNKKGNAIINAQLPTIDKLNKFYPHIALQASGISVGLPWGEPGNSEVGHITLGTGQTIYQNMPRITMAIQDGEFFKNSAFLEAIEHCRKNNSALHLMGLIGKGGIHSIVDHLYGLLELARNQKFEKVFLHLFTDGRDSSPASGTESLKELQRKLDIYKTGRIATISGRYYAMDRNNNWNRIKLAYDAITEGIGEQIADPIDYLNKSYKQEIFDEYIKPAVVMENGKPLATVSDNDSLIFFNFREDRARQITKAFALPDFNKFNKKPIKNLCFVAMVQYEADLPVSIAFPVIKVSNCLGNVLSKNKLIQLRIAETEKFAHVTYFFNGGKEEAFSGEDRVIIPSKDVAKFDEAPEMSAQEITDKVIDFVQKEKYDFILINYANADIIGHTGNEQAAIAAIETVDKCLEKLIKEVILKNGCLLITADHGNVEEMVSLKTGEENTEHSANPVPLWFITGENHLSDTEKNPYSFETAGLLSDIAPTILELFNIEKPIEISGESLLEELS
ncbi:MAG TPA: 2,3-bisphosphoglycerate-independent phosphoglycerate mutase [Candidatus Moranbacteria bacterium]|nr:2,3-bisphosphoglycerate-independent phosphoglycerate mutase [Candidatus Moranbacteria bacterium]HAT74809.1 2,3-bisphosphoglycerate-independent phosphoglycerate mutase [Candidatus Moranbacteria bacterium]